MKAINMKKYDQTLDNFMASAIFKTAFDELDAQKTYNYKRLRSCTAWVFETENYYLLKSYDTFIGCIDKRSNTFVDVLRKVYCYTATSAQHLAKFRHDYTPYPWNSPAYIYRHI